MRMPPFVRCARGSSSRRGRRGGVRCENVVGVKMGAIEEWGLSRADASPQQYLVWALRVFGFGRCMAEGNWFVSEVGAGTGRCTDVAWRKEQKDDDDDGGLVLNNDEPRRPYAVRLVFAAVFCARGLEALGVGPGVGM